MAAGISYRIDNDNDLRRVALAGEITEDADFAPLVDQKCSRMVIDLSEITRINSCGVREWIEFVRASNEKGTKLVLERCAPFIVNQLNMIANFAGAGGEVRSVFAPYYCQNCDLEHLTLIDLSGDDVQEPQRVVPCPRCKEESEFDDLPEIYLQFRASTK